MLYTVFFNPISYFVVEVGVPTVTDSFRLGASASDGGTESNE